MINTPVFYNPNSIYPPPNYMSQPYNFPQNQQCVTPPVPYPVNLNNLPQYNPNFRVVPSFQDNFQYNQEEQQFRANNPYGDIVKFNQDKRNYKRAIEYIDYINSQKSLPNLEKYIGNPAFDSLAQSKYFKDERKFENLVKIVSSLDKTQREAYNKISSPNYYAPYIPDTNMMFAYIDVNNCIKNLDNFFKSEKVSEDLKKYMLNATDRLSDLWFVHMNLGTKEITADNLLYPCPIY